MTIIETDQKAEDTKPVRVSRAYPIGAQILFVLGVGLLLAVLILAGLVWKFENDHAEAIYPGISVDGVDVSGLTLCQAVLKVNANLTYGREGKIHITNGSELWTFAPEALGFSYDPVKAVREAYSIGREQDTLNNLREQLDAMRQGVNITPGIIYDQAKAYQVIQEIALETNIPLIEPSLTLDNTQVKVVKGQAGRSVDINATLKKIEPYLLIQSDGSLPLVIEERTPVTVNVEETAQLAESILAQALTINAPNPEAGVGPWVIEPENLASLMIIAHQSNEEGNSYELTLNRDALIAYITSFSPTLQTEPINARMIFNDDTKQLEVLESAVVGSTVDIEKSVDSIIEKLTAGQHQSTLVMQEVLPPVNDQSLAEELGITELVAQTTSYFYGSDPARVQNIRAAYSSFHGVMVAPGEVFSMADYLTDISLENGYAEALIIVGAQTVEGVGGGVCQVSTTLLRNAFFGGFPIVERHPHAYRVGYYEQQSNGAVDTNLAGLDATVYVPLVDFKFRNDTPYWLLMETYMGNNSLTWKFYSTSDGREVEWWSTGITNVITPPDPIYREDPSLPTGTIEQVDWPVNGATVEVYRTVTRDGQIIDTDTIRTVYTAWPAGYNYGPGTEIPEQAEPAED